MHGAIAWFARNPVAANLLMLCIIAFGVSGLLGKIVVEVFPEIELNSITVTIAYPGATPGQVEEGVTLLAEDALYQIEGIESMTTRSRENGATIYLDIIQGYNINQVQETIKNELASVTDFPEESEPPGYSIASRKRQVIDVIVHGNMEDDELIVIAEQIRDELLELGTSYVSIESDRSYEVAIEISERTLREYNLTFAQVANIIRQSDRDRPAGSLTTGKGEILLRTKSPIQSARNYADIVIPRKNGDLTLGNLATIKQTFTSQGQVNERYNQQPAVNISVYRTGDENALKIGDQVRQYIAKKQKELPDHIGLSHNRDSTKIFKSRMQLLLSNALYGGLLVILILSLFLRPSVAFWISLGIPISFMGGVAFMPVLDISINMISMFAFILVLGIVVDDAIITGESVYSHIRKGTPVEQAVITGTREVSIPVIFGILTTVAAFYPLATVTGGIANIFLQIPAIVIPVLLLSLLESMFILPAHLRHVSVSRTSNNLIVRAQQYIASKLEDFIEHIYQPTLVTCLKYRYTTLIVFLAVSLMTFATIPTGWITFNFLPSVPSETLRASLTMPADTAFDVTDSYVTKLESAAIKLQQQYGTPDQPVILSVLSSGKTTSGFVRVQLASPEDRPEELSNQRLLREWRQNTGDLPGVEQLAFTGQIGRFSSPISFQLISSDIASMRQVSQELQKYMRQFSNLNNIRDDFASGKQELQVILKPEAGSLGLTLDDLSTQIRSGFYGLEVQTMITDRNPIKVILRYPSSERNSLKALNNIKIQTNDGSVIPFSEVAYLEKSRSPATINRENRKRTLRIEADADKSKANLPEIRAQLNDRLQQILQKYPQVQFQQKGESSDMTSALRDLLASFSTALFVMYGLLAIPLKSYFKPFIIMLIIPFSSSYAILGHVIMGLDLSLMSLMGIIALSGVALNDALILVVFINRRLQETDIYTAVLEAGQKRFRPVLLTSLTTFFGLLPLMFETSTQAQFILPTGVSLGWGILFTTLATLILVPIFYLVLHDIINIKRFFKSDRVAKKATP